MLICLTIINKLECRLCRKKEWYSNLVSKEDNDVPMPHLVILGDTYYLKIDDTKVETGTESLKAFDILFKSFFVFDLKYDKHLSKFFNFFEVFVYKTTKVAKSNVEAFYVSLK